MKKALFLDRDGVINLEKNYLFKIEDFEFINGIFNLCKQFQDDGFIIIVITNQAGIARGYYTDNDFWQLTFWMIEKFRDKGIIISKVFYCPHHPKFTGICDCRKPMPGMILQAQREFDIDLAKSVLIGDRESDLEAGARAGVGNLAYIGDYLDTPQNEAF